MTAIRNDSLHVPEWTPGDRIYKALKDSGIGVIAMAEFLDVSRKTIGNWIAGANRPPASALRVIAEQCHVPYEWLKDGTAPVVETEAVPVVRRQGLEPRTR